MLPKKLKATPEARALLIRQAATLTLTLILFLREKMDQKSETQSQCLKITEKVSFNMASEASYFYGLYFK